MNVFFFSFLPKDRDDPSLPLCLFGFCFCFHPAIYRTQEHENNNAGEASERASERTKARERKLKKREERLFCSFFWFPSREELFCFVCRKKISDGMWNGIGKYMGKWFVALRSWQMKK